MCTHTTICIDIIHHPVYIYKYQPLVDVLGETLLHSCHAIRIVQRGQGLNHLRLAKYIYYIMYIYTLQCVYILCYYIIYTYRMQARDARGHSGEDIRTRAFRRSALRAAPEGFEQEQLV